MKKNLLLAVLCLLTMPLWAGNEPTGSMARPSALSLQGLQPMAQPSLLIPASTWNRQMSNDFIMDNGMSLGYIYSDVFQLGFFQKMWLDHIYFGSTAGFNFGKDYFASERPTQPTFNPMGYTMWTLGFKVGPVMLGCGAGYTYDAIHARWLYMFGFLPGFIGSAVSRIADATPTLFDGVYFMWGPEAQLQLGPIMLTGGYHIAPKLDMNHIFLGVGYNLPLGSGF